MGGTHVGICRTYNQIAPLRFVSSHLDSPVRFIMFWCNEIFQTHFNNSWLNVGFNFFFLKSMLQHFVKCWKSSSEYFGGLRETALCIGIIYFSFWKDGADPPPDPFIFPLLPPPPSLPVALLVLEDETADYWEGGGVSLLCAPSASGVFCFIKKNNE